MKPLLPALLLIGSVPLLVPDPAALGWNLARRTDDRLQPGYVRGIDTATRHGGKASATLRALPDRPAGSFGVLTQAIVADRYAGKRVRLRGWLKAKEVQRAGLWLRIDGANRTLAFDNMQTDRPVTGSQDWTRAEIVLDVPKEAIGLHFGALLIGPGQLWVDDLSLETVPASVAVTAEAAPDPPGGRSVERLYDNALASPINLDFER